MSFYKKDSAFAEKPLKTIIEFIFSIVMVFVVVLFCFYTIILPSSFRRGRPDPIFQRCNKNVNLLSIIISDYNYGLKEEEQIKEINDDTLAILKKEEYDYYKYEDYAPPSKECKYIITNEKTFNNNNKVICEYHEKINQEIAKRDKEKSESMFINFLVYPLIFGVLESIFYFLLALYYNEKKRNISFFIWNIVGFIPITIISYFISPVQKTLVTTSKGEHYFTYKRIHPLSDIFPFLERREEITPESLVNFLKK